MEDASFVEGRGSVVVPPALRSWAGDEGDEGLLW